MFSFFKLVMGDDRKIQIPLNGVSLAPADAGPILNAGLVAGNPGPELLSNP